LKTLGERVEERATKSAKVSGRLLETNLLSGGATESERVQQYIHNLREAVASCSGALTESLRSGAIGRLEAERLQVARVCIMLTLEALCKREGQPLSTTKWFETMPLRGEFRAGASVFLRARPIGSER